MWIMAPLGSKFKFPETIEDLREIAVALGIPHLLQCIEEPKRSLLDQARETHRTIEDTYELLVKKLQAKIDELENARKARDAKEVSSETLRRSAVFRILDGRIAQLEAENARLREENRQIRSCFGIYPETEAPFKAPDGPVIAEET